MFLMNRSSKMNWLFDKLSHHWAMTETPPFLMLHHRLHIDAAHRLQHEHALVVNLGANSEILSQNILLYLHRVKI
jgi:hypothetical protein